MTRWKSTQIDTLTPTLIGNSSPSTDRLSDGSRPAADRPWSGALAVGEAIFEAGHAAYLTRIEYYYYGTNGLCAAWA